MKKLLWIGDAVCDSGFATVTHSVLEHLHRRWEVKVLGVNYRGDPHPYPYPIYPAGVGGDQLGHKRLPQLWEQWQATGDTPDVVLINNDPWNVAQFLEHNGQQLKWPCPVVAYLPVDGKNLRPSYVKSLNRLECAIWYTESGRKEAELGGYTGRSSIAPHGVDCKVFRRVDKQEARTIIGLGGIPDDSFVVGNVNRNSLRKRLDLSIEYFAEWVNRYSVPRAFLYLHAAREVDGWDLDQLAQYYKIDLILPHGKTSFKGCQKAIMPYVYGSMDLHITTSMGEGWGLSSVEAAACGVPQIVPDFAALGEWAKPCSLTVPCRQSFTYPKGTNHIGMVPDKEAFVTALQEMYSNPQTREWSSQSGLQLAREARFDWSNVAAQFHEVLDSCVAASPVSRAG